MWVISAYVLVFVSPFVGRYCVFVYNVPFTFNLALVLYKVKVNRTLAIGMSHHCAVLFKHNYGKLKHFMD